MQAHINLEINPHFDPKAPGQGLVLKKTLRGINQPLHLRFRGKLRWAERPIEGLHRGHGHGLTQQNIGIWEGLGHRIQKWLMKDHHRFGFCSPADLLQKRNGRQGFHDDPILLSPADRRREAIDVAIHSRGINKHNRASRPRAL